MSLADEIFELLGECERVEVQRAALDERVGSVFEAIEQDVMKVQFLKSLEADLAEDSVESLMRAQDRFAELVKARIQQKLDEAS